MTKKGFTLIELLAVILILGIIALIAIPVVNNIIEESKKGAFETTANNLVSSIEDACQIEQLKGDAITSTYTFSNGTVSPSLNIKGKLPTDGTATVDSNCNVTLSVTNDRYTATKASNSEDVVVEKGNNVGPVGNTVYANGTAVYFNPVTGAKCTSGQAVSTLGTKTGCMKWYTFNDGGSSSDKINLILDHNTTAYVKWIASGNGSNGPVDVTAQLQTDTSGWAGVPTRTDNYALDTGTVNYTINYSGYKARLLTVQEVATITGNTGFGVTTSNQTNYFYLDSKTTTQTVTGTNKSSYAWLYEYTLDCENVGCYNGDDGTRGYWTASSIHNYPDGSWGIRWDGSLNYAWNNSSSDFGVRPVITIDKATIK